MRSLVFRFQDISALSNALGDTHGSLPLPEGETVGDGEWVLAIFEVGSRRRATAAAARGVRAAGDTHLEFERRDWDRLVGFATVRSEHMRSARPAALTSSSGRIPAAAEISPVSQREPSAYSDAPPPSLESSRIPFGARILVVDDDQGTGDEIRAMLAELGLVVEVAASGERASARLGEQAFDALVVDFHTKAVDPRAFVMELRRDGAGAGLPVLFLSSRPTSRDVVDAFAMGADDFLPRPFRAPELAARIFGLLRRARLARAAGGAGR